MMKTYWVLGKIDFDGKLPDPSLALSESEYDFK